MTKATFEQQMLRKMEMLQETVDRLAARIGVLERQHMATMPYGPITMPAQWPINQCTKCGLQLDKVMSYCCPQPNCPCGLGPVMCSTNTSSPS